MPKIRNTEDEYTRPDLVSARYRARRNAYFEAELLTADVQATANTSSASQANEGLAVVIIRSFHPPPPEESGGSV